VKDRRERVRCIGCGVMFTPRYSGQRYHSGECFAVFGANNAAAEKRVLQSARYGGHSLCQECRFSTGLCSWSSKFVPVKGWRAIPTKVSIGKQRGKTMYVDSYRVLSCPKFEPERGRRLLK